MKRFFRLTLFLAVFLLVFSCKKGVEISRYPLSDVARNFFPYSQGDQIEFQHSNVFQFQLMVYQKRDFWERTEQHHSGDNYSSYEVQELKLSSTEPELQIVFRITPENMGQPLSAIIYNQPYQLFSMTEPQWESLKINGKTYENVFVLTYPYPSTGEIIADSIFINQSNGLLKISMTNDEAYSLLP